MKIIGLTGVAGCGKDTFFSILKEKIKCKRLSLADELKNDVRSWCIEHYGIDPVSCTREEKEIIRPFLVFHGTQKRQQTQGRYWIEKAHKKISLLNMVGPEIDYLVVTDIRYCDFEKDELYWLKNELKGSLVHVSLYDRPFVLLEKEQQDFKIDKVFALPANSEEARNDPRLKDAADYTVEWPMIDCPEEELRKNLNNYVEDFLEWMKSR